MLFFPGGAFWLGYQGALGSCFWPRPRWVQYWIWEVPGHLGKWNQGGAPRTSEEGLQLRGVDGAWASFRMWPQQLAGQESPSHPCLSPGC